VSTNRKRRHVRREGRDLDEIVSVDSLAAGGDGVGRLADGRVVFVRLAAPGDRVRIRAHDSGNSFLRVRDFELVESAPRRVQPACEVFGRCGGCAWQHVDYAVQLESKRQILCDALQRIGKLGEIPPIEVVPSPQPYGYRGRARVLASGSRVGYRRFREHVVEPVSSCPVLVPELEAELGALAQRVRAQGDAHSSNQDREWELLLDRNGRVRCIELEGSAAAAGEIVELEVAGEVIRVAPGGFAQANPSLYQTMFDCVVRALDDVVSGTLVELFAGAGFFTIGLADRFASMLAVESDARACVNLAENLAAAGVDHVDVRNARAEDVLEELGDCEPAAVLLDPPRIGLAKGAPEKLAESGAHRIAYLSCEPATLARDLAVLCERGYCLRRLELIDVFPQTPHVESLAVLERGR